MKIKEIIRPLLLGAAIVTVPAIIGKKLLDDLCLRTHQEVTDQLNTLAKSDPLAAENCLRRSEEKSKTCYDEADSIPLEIITGARSALCNIEQGNTIQKCINNYVPPYTLSIEVTERDEEKGSDGGSEDIGTEP